MEVTRIATVNLTQIIDVESEDMLIDKQEYARRLKARLDKESFDNVNIEQVKDFYNK